ncbi:hydroxymethylglutaryl-CoA lyase [Bdellovibrionota bacterium FG-1]
MAADITLFEVGPRDGLQNEAQPISTTEKLKFISGLVEAGVRHLEVGAFVRPDRVPQMADTAQLYAAIRERRLKLGRAQVWALVPNVKGMERALLAGATHVAVFTAATESFTQRNIGMTIRESLTEFKEVIALARANRISVRGYVSTAFGCPFEGKVSARKALKVIERVVELGVDQVSIGDTIGVATPKDVDQVLAPALRACDSQNVAVHFHDTRGTALANTLRALELGVKIVDASAGGLGGCPFAPGAAGNLASEDLIYMLNGMGIKTGVDLKKLSQTSLRLARVMKRPLSSRYLQSLL